MPVDLECANFNDNDMDIFLCWRPGLKHSGCDYNNSFKLNSVSTGISHSWDSPTALLWQQQLFTSLNVLRPCEDAPSRRRASESDRVTSVTPSLCQCQWSESSCCAKAAGVQAAPVRPRRRGDEPENREMCESSSGSVYPKSCISRLARTCRSEGQMMHAREAKSKGTKERGNEHLGSCDGNLN